MANGNGGATKTGFVAGVAVVVAVVALVFFFGGLFYMQGLMKENAPELLWTRAVYLFGAVEALAFAGAGYLFGKEVNRQRAENAEARADQKEADAVEAKSTVSNVMGKVQSLKALALSKAGSEGEKTATYSSLGGQADAAIRGATQRDLQEIATHAQDLFPDV